LGAARGSREVHPNDHVNMSQSSNDVIPTAIHVSALLAITEDLAPALETLRASLEAKAAQFHAVIKTGRTHLQDATPIRLGQEFRGYAGQVEHALRSVAHVSSELRMLALGGTAVGTGVNADLRFAPRAIELLSELTGLQLRETDNHFQAQSTLDAVVETSGVLRMIAISLSKIADDIRWMGSGPRAGLGEIILPEVQPGSSIMPGKVNPVIAESLLQVAAQVIGNDAAIAVAGQGGHFELNMMMPVAAYNLLESIALLAASARNFAAQCVDGITATERGPAMVSAGLAIATALAPVIGYDRAAEIAKEAARSGRTVGEVAAEQLDMPPEELARILDPARMTG
jgi:fumarate hydratase class II